MVNKFAVVLGLGVVASVSGCRQQLGDAMARETAPRGTTRPEEEPADKATLRLIESLASSFPGPVLLRNGKPDKNLTHGILPEDHPMDWAFGSITRKVWAARELLLRGDPEDLPNLMDHLMRYVEDKRYSYTSPPAGPRFCVKVSVGEACREIIERRVSPDVVDYINRRGADGKLHMRPRYFDAVQKVAALKEWWHERRGRALVALQIEALEWRIEQERKIGFANQEQEGKILAPLMQKLEVLRSSLNQQQEERSGCAQRLVAPLHL